MFQNKIKKKYIDKLWDKYQYPWPEDWLKEDSFL